MRWCFSLPTLRSTCSTSRTRADRRRSQIATSTFNPIRSHWLRQSPRGTRAVIINSPNNPTGIIYPEERIAELGEVIRDAENRYGTEIYLVADEPYRKLIYSDSPYAFIYPHHQRVVGGHVPFQGSRARRGADRLHRSQPFGPGTKRFYGRCVLRAPNTSDSSTLRPSCNES